MERLAKLIPTIWDLGAFTWSPKSGKIYDIEIQDQSFALFWELVEGGRNIDPDSPIYLIAVTCNIVIAVNSVLEQACVKLVSITNQPLFGTWTDEDGIKYLDAVLPIQLICEDEAIRMAKRYGQKFILRIDPNGKATAIKIR